MCCDKIGHEAPKVPGIDIPVSLLAPLVPSDRRSNVAFVEMTQETQQEFPETHRAVRWHPPSYDVRVEDVPFPKWEVTSGK